MVPLPVDELVKISIYVCGMFLRLVVALIVGLIQVLVDLISGGISLFITHQQVKKAREIQTGPLEILNLVSESRTLDTPLDETALAGVVLGETVYKE